MSEGESNRPPYRHQKSKNRIQTLTLEPNTTRQHRGRRSRHEQTKNNMAQPWSSTAILTCFADTVLRHVTRLNASTVETVQTALFIECAEDSFELCAKLQTYVFFNVPALQHSVCLCSFVTMQITGIHHKVRHEFQCPFNFPKCLTIPSSARIVTKSTTNSETPVRMHAMRDVQQTQCKRKVLLHMWSNLAGTISSKDKTR